MFPGLLSPPESAEMVESFKEDGGNFEFKIGDSIYTLAVAEQPTEYERGGRYSESITKRHFRLIVSGVEVFEYAMTETVTDGPDFPSFDYRMGQITSYIDGNWNSEIADLLRRIRDREKVERDQKRMPTLQAQMKKFGI
jgi:hypothetical protein